ncbi:MAG: hypothetical protein M1819_005487 [Sarea resinae]|nr:MAG: hypothetical protein M1819_005487 [Sarea resinae]
MGDPSSSLPSLEDVSVTAPKKPQQPRQLLSCTKCRERKVKSYELRKLRSENNRLKEWLRAHRLDESEEEAMFNLSNKPAFTRQRRFKGPERSDNLYFGSPGLASVINEASLSLVAEGHVNCR